MIDHKLAEGMMGLHAPPQAINAQQFAARTSELLELYPKEFSYAQMNLLDSHDMPPLPEPGQRRHQPPQDGLHLCPYLPCAPTIYYGDEIGLTGERDPLCRKTFPWDKSNWNEDLHDYLREVIAVRHALPALRTGSYEPIYAEGDVLAFLRKHKLDNVLVVLNNSVSKQTLDLNVGDAFSNETELQDQLGDASYRVEMA